MMKKDSLLQTLQSHQPGFLGMPHVKHYSIILPIIEKNNELHLVFEVRSLHMRRQPGEICFPGGRVDEKDPHPEATALREMEEEIGVEQSRVKNLFELGTMVTPFGLKLNAFAGLIDNVQEWKLNPMEVDEVFTVPLQFFFENQPEKHYIHIEVTPDQDFPYESIQNGKDYQWQKVPYEENFYYYEGRVIWGLTARVLKDFIKVLK
ncbi:NUDIX hydrolase [Halalkalibacillus halophilus]|uniref:NUDIX hydrolase n=1 Tax=Halalkalibacillus halophilus TaxID=392827 RepID=UPI0003FEF945|nr:CoA pyrophosphatase [Halalkalibacillus halophilus]